MFPVISTAKNPDDPREEDEQHDVVANGQEPRPYRLRALGESIKFSHLAFDSTGAPTKELVLAHKQASTFNRSCKPEISLLNPRKHTALGTQNVLL